MKIRVKSLVSISLSFVMIMALFFVPKVNAEDTYINDQNTISDNDISYDIEEKQTQLLSEKAGNIILKIEDGSITISDGNYSQGSISMPIPSDNQTITITGKSNTNNIIVNDNVNITIKDLELISNDGKSLIDLQSGNINLTLEGENKLTNDVGGDNAVIRVSSESSLTMNGDGKLSIINGQEDGKSEAHGSGIGGNSLESPKNITINGGNISILQYGTSAAIGGGTRADSGKIKITDGSIDVKVLPAGNGLESAGTGIGGGGENIKDQGSIGSAGNANVTIIGGNVKAYVKSSVFLMGFISSGAAIGSGENKGGTIYIGGDAIVDAEAENLACAIGSSNATYGSIGSSIDPAPDNPMNITIEGSAKVKARTHSLDYYGQGAYSGAAIGMSVQNLQPCTITIGGNADVTANGSWYGAGIGGGYVQINDQAQPMKINIKDNARVNASSEVYGAGIGSGYGDGGAESPEIMIEGNPTVVANGGWGAAGIGGGKGTSGGHITITGGNITATGDVGGVEEFGAIGGAGIGAGAVDDSDGLGGTAEDIIITGGHIKAYGSIRSAGIGGGNIKAVTTTGSPSIIPQDDNAGGVDNITISGNAQIYAVGGEGASAIGIGAIYEEAQTPVIKNMEIGENVSIEAYADGSLFAIDGAEVKNITNSILNARFAKKANAADKEKNIQLFINDKADKELTLPANYRSFASNVDVQKDDVVYVLDHETKDKRYAYYLNDNRTRNIEYNIPVKEMLEKDELNWVEMETIDAQDLVAYEGGLGSDGGQTTGDALPEPVWSQQINNSNIKVGDTEWNIDEKGLPFDWEYLDEDGNQVKTSATVGTYSLYVLPLEEIKNKDVFIDDKLLLIPDNGLKVATVSVRDITDNEKANNLSTDIFKKIYNYKAPSQNDVSKILSLMKVSISQNSALNGNFNENGTQDEDCDITQPHAHVQEDTIFYKNGKEDMPVNSNAKIALLYDNLLSDVLGQEERMNKLHQKSMSVIDEEIFDESQEVEREFKYIDLVDMNDGNLWVGTKDEDVTVYIPYPDGVTLNDAITVTYYDALTRDYTIDMEQSNLDEEIEKSNAHVAHNIKKQKMVFYLICHLSSLVQLKLCGKKQKNQFQIMKILLQLSLLKIKK